MALKGLTEEETILLQSIFQVWTPWKRDKMSKEIGKFLDGHPSKVDKTVALKDDILTKIEAAKRSRKK